MNKNEIIQKKITAFFKSKESFLKRIEFENLSIIISSENNELFYDLLNNGAQMQSIKLDEVLKLTLIEKAFVSNKSVEEILKKSFDKYSSENNVPKNKIQLLISANGYYYLCIDGQKKQTITINDIL